jgi:hypothetical protein
MSTTIALEELLRQLKLVDEALHDETDASAKRELRKAIAIVDAALKRGESIDTIRVLDLLGKFLDKLPQIINLLSQWLQ